MTGLLSLIWTTALALVLVAFAALAALIVARVRREWEERSDPGRRARIAKALLHFAAAGGPPPVFAISNRIERQTLVETALDTARIMRGPAKVRLVQFLRDLGLDKRLRRQALGGSMRDRLSALEALALFPDPETIATLHRAELARDLRIWLTALRTRTENGAGPDMLELLEFVERAGGRRSPVMHDLIAARALENLPEALRTLRGVLPGPTRALLIRAIGESKRIEGLDPLRVSLHNPDPAVRSAAAGALGALGFDAAGDALARATRDVDWRVRLKASEAIGRLDVWRHADCLTPLLDDPVWWVRFRAEEALKRLGAFGVRRLKEVAATDSKDKRPAAARGARR
jgi:HEAT repeat protein